MVGTSLRGNNSMEDLTSRLGTFAEWPSGVPVKPKDLAEAGFYYVGQEARDDSVCCYSCGGKLRGWEAGDNPEKKHRENFGDKCHFIQSKGTPDIFFENSSSWGSQPVRYDPICDDDMEKEEQRLRSFQRNNGWPGVVDPRKLAMAGFYFTGVDDNVKCFACDLSLRRWEAEDDPISEHLKYQPTCPFLSRLSSSRQRPTYSTIPAAPKPADVYHDQRPNYTEVVTVFGNGGYSNRPSTFRSVPVSSEPSYFAGSSVMNHPNASLTGSVASRIQRKQESTSGHHTPNYASEHARLHTFINWPKDCPVQPKELIDAGFYYTGENDKARCFKCGVTLAGWEPEDTPWGEHEKWSKDCPLVKERMRRRNPYSSATGSSGTLVMPKEQSWHSPKDNLVQEPVTYPHKPLPLRVKLAEMPAKPGRSPTEQGESVPFESEYSLEKRTSKQSQEKEIFHIQKAVQELLDRGYDFGTIEESIQYKTKVCKESIDSPEELFDAVVSFMEANSGVTGRENQHQLSEEQTVKSTVDGKRDEFSKQTHPVSQKSTGFSLSVDPQALHRQVEKMQEAHTCKICLDAEIGVVFLPCGHLVCCSDCASEIQLKSPPICPVCRRCIENTIRTYFP